MSVDVGDAVLKFLGDTTHLDATFDGVGPKAEAAFAPAAEAAEDAGERMQGSMREARAEVGLLGEEMGIRLPRHVRGFVAELPGVGQALGKAFEATAVLFLLQALVQGTEKLSNFIAQTFINTKAMQDSNAEIAAQNSQLEKLNKQYEAAKERLASLTEGPLAKLRKEEDDLTKAFKANAAAVEANKTLHDGAKDGWERAKDTVLDFGKAVLSYTTGISLATSAENDYTKALRRQQDETLRIFEEKKALNEEAKAHDEDVRQTHIRFSLEELENQKKVALATATTEENKYQLEQYYQTKKLSLVKEYGEKEKAQVASLAADIEVAQIEHANKIQAAFVKMMLTVKQAQVDAAYILQASILGNVIALTPLQQAFVKGQDAAHAMGVTLRTDLVGSLERAKEALKDFLNAGIVDPVAFKAFEKQVANAQKALDNFGKAQDQFKFKSKGLWKEYVQDLKSTELGLDQIKQTGITAFDNLSKDIEGAFSQVVMGEGNVGKALERATASSLASIASQAAVKALFYTGEGFAALAGFNGGSAANYFTAAAEMAAVAGAAGIAGRALAGASGAGGSSSSTQQGFSSVSSSTGGGQRGPVNVRGFADGALVASPTLAMIGEGGGREAVLPLDNDEAMARIGEAVSRGIAMSGGAGGGHHLHVNVQGLVSPDNLKKVVKQISSMVKSNQVHLQASDSLRVTKRSA